MVKTMKSIQTLRKLTQRFCELLDDAGINGELTVNDTGRLFTETMYDGKYHFSQINNPVYWAFGNDDFNIILATNGSMIELFNICVHNTGNGLGTKVMNILLDAADDTSIRINLNAIPTEITEHLEHYHLNNELAGKHNFEPINDELTKGTDRLIKFYESFGFYSYAKKFQMIYVPQKLEQ